MFKFFFLVFFDANEQFELYSFFKLTNIFLYMFLIFIFITLFFFVNFCLSGNASVLFVNLYGFIKTTVGNNVGARDFLTIFYTPYFFVVFFFIIFSNLVGLLTFSYAIASLLVIPFFLSTVNFVFTAILMLRKFKINFFGGFLPTGTSLLIAPLLILIEFISYFIKLISLAVRLFANLFAGHILIKVLLSLVWALALSNAFGGFILAFFILALIAAILCLEIFICALQAYVFTNLASVYLDQAINILNH